MATPINKIYLTNKTDKMKASELRIGNKVQQGIILTICFDNGVLGCHIIESEIDSTGGKFYELQDIEPIPLTPQWLLASGLEKISNDVYSIPLPNGNGVDLVLEWGDCCIKRNHVGKEKKDGDKNPYDYAYIKAPRHIHELQNLYHALTGHELEFDLTKIEKE